MSTSITSFVGLDIGDRYTHFCVMNENGEVTDRGKFRTQMSAVENWLREFEGRARVAVETGTHTRWIGLLFRAAGHEVVVANTRKVRLISANAKKSDRNDAELLARLVRVDPTMLFPVDGFFERNAYASTMLRGRNGLVRARTTLVVQVRSLAKVHGIRIPAGDAEYFHNGPASHLPEHLRIVLEPTLQMIEQLSLQVRAYDRALKELAAELYPETEILETIPGVGPVTALAFAIVIGRPERFAKSREVGAYLGLTPARDQSGDNDPERRITRHGDRYLRSLLVCCAQRILGKHGPDCALRQWGLKKAGTGKSTKKRAVVGVARKLAVMMHRMMVTKKPFEPWPDGEPELEAVRVGAA